jgi:SAM-dependent methyltransferase
VAPERLVSAAFFGAELARIHHEHFGFVAEAGARTLLAETGGEGAVFELGVGSGVSSRLLLDAGHEVEGVDGSEEMLALARAHAPGGRYRLGNLWQAKLPSGLRAVTGFGEAFNYVVADPPPSLPLLEALATRVRAALVPGGIFLFDAAAPTRGGEGGERGARFEVDGALLVMEELETDGLIDRRVDTFVHVEGDLWRRLQEHHALVTFAPEAVEAALARAGFASVERLESYEGYAFQPGWFGYRARR